MIANPREAVGSSTCARLDQVSKLFGSFAALRQVTVDLEPGRCYVLIGENGAGKSTLLRILAGLLRPSFGTVRVFGDEEPHEARARIGYMSHAPMLYDELTAQENLSYFASLYPGRACLSPAEALRQVGLDPELNRAAGPVFARHEAAHLAGAGAAAGSRAAAAGRAVFKHGCGERGTDGGAAGGVSPQQPDDCDYHAPARDGRADCGLGAGASRRAVEVV